MTRKKISISPCPQDAVRSMLYYIGEDLDREGIKETPARVVRAWNELFAGYKTDPYKLIKSFDSEGHQELVILRNIEFYSTCEHHLLPFYGKAHVAYIPGVPPNDKVIGSSKMARIVDCFARRAQIQERLGQQVTDVIMRGLGALGAACIIDARHLCMMARGVGKQNSIMTTSSMKGRFLEDTDAGRAARAELLVLLK